MQGMSSDSLPDSHKGHWGQLPEMFTLCIVKKPKFTSLERFNPFHASKLRAQDLRSTFLFFQNPTK